MIQADSVAAVREAYNDLKPELKGEKGDLATMAREGLKAIDTGIALCERVVAAAEMLAAAKSKPEEAPKEKEAKKD